jgi:Family of unknown function (DUF6152)
MNRSPNLVSLAISIAIATAIALTAPSALAHHSFAMFDLSKTITVEGTVKDFRWTNPHVFIQLLVENDSGSEQEWSIEMTSPEHLSRAGWRPETLKPGEHLSLEIHPMRDGILGGQYLSGTGPGGPLVGSPALARAAEPPATTDVPEALPDWSGQWENVGAIPSPDGGFYQSLDEVLEKLQWDPPLKPETQALVDQIVAGQRKAMAAMRQGVDPGGATRACTFGYPILMIESPLMFEILPTPKETALIFSSREIRHVYTDGRGHPEAGDLWLTRWGHSIGHWEGQTLVIDTVAVKSAFPGREGPAVMAFGGIEDSLMIALLSTDAHFVERIRMLDDGQLEDQMTIIDPANLTEPWHLTRTYQRVANIDRMVYEDCEGEERNPIVDGKFILTPPPSAQPPR